MDFNWFQEAAPQGDAAVRAIIDRVQRERGEIAASRMPDPHAAPTCRLTVNQARYCMQQHRSCRADECGRKRAAWRVLVAAGRVRPDSRRVPR